MPLKHACTLFLVLRIWHRPIIERSGLLPKLSKLHSTEEDSYAAKVGVLERYMPASSEKPRRDIRRSRDVVSRVVAEEAIVVPIRRGTADMDSIFTFNEAGTKLWALIETNRSASELAAHLETEYGLSAEKAAADTEQFLADLIDAGLVEPS